MIAQVGLGANLVALLASARLVQLGWRAARSPHGPGAGELRLPVVGVLLGAVASFVALEVGILSDDFSLEFVAEHSARDTPLPYKVATAWAALEGSLVLWGLVLAVWTTCVFGQRRRLAAAGRLSSEDRLGAGALAVMGLVAVFFFGLLVTVANPFRVLAEVPTDGPGPNPLLQNHPLMAVHPPLLYLGYVGFTAPFAFAIAALALGERGVDWVRRTQRWSLAAWVFLTAGIVCGAWWSYEVLGWGGYWAWDPVENASLLPWLVGTAYLHSAVVQVRRGLLQAWSVALLLATFALTIFGTFLTRSGVIASVHSFTESPIGPALLAFLGVVLVASFGLFAWRADAIAPARGIDSLLSREGSFLVNNLLLAVLAIAVLVGTTYPILLEAFTGDQVSVGRPFFDRVAAPLSLVLLVTMGLGPLLPYRAGAPRAVWARLRWPLRAGLGAAATAVVLGQSSVIFLVMLFLAVTVVVTSLVQLAQAASRRHTGTRSWPSAVGGVIVADPGFWAGQLSHVGLVVLALGVAASSSLADRAEVRLEPGDREVFGPYDLRYEGLVDRSQAERPTRAARLLVERGAESTVLEPRLTTFSGAAQPVGTPSVWTTRSGDELYASVVVLEDRAAVITLWRRPLVFLVWIGGFVMAGGGAVGLVLRRRTRRRPATGPAVDPGLVDA